MPVALLTSIAMCAFAANSILCRLALGSSSIDPASFSALRLAAGALALYALHRATRGRTATLGGSWPSAALLFLYAFPFSFAYVSIATGTGALILFGAVQATMLSVGIVSGERVTLAQAAGLMSAACGLVYLVLPGIAAPAPIGSALMAMAGVAWGFYSLRGRGASDALSETTGNFLRSAPLAALAPLALGGLSASPRELSLPGALLAVSSGALASGLGYAVWYAALRGLSRTRAATVQLSVPILAALGGVLFMGEAVSPRLLVSAALVLGGLGFALRVPRVPSPSPNAPQPRAE